MVFEKYERCVVVVFFLKKFVLALVGERGGCFISGKKEGAV